MIIVHGKILIEFESYSHYHSSRMVLHMASLFVAATIAVYGFVMKYVLQNVAKSAQSTK